MSILKKVSNKKGLYLVECPGCNMLHQIHTDTKDSIRWDFNGNMEKPTFTPSLLVRYTWGEERTENVCHSFIKDGYWQFLNDCTHELAGKTVPMIEIK